MDRQATMIALESGDKLGRPACCRRVRTIVTEDICDFPFVGVFYEPASGKEAMSLFRTKRKKCYGQEKYFYRAETETQ